MRLIRQFRVDVGTSTIEQTVERVKGFVKTDAEEQSRRGPRGTTRFVFDVAGLINDAPASGVYPPHADGADKKQPRGGQLIVQTADGVTQVVAASSEPAPAPKQTKVPPLFESARAVLAAIGDPEQTALQVVLPVVEHRARKKLQMPAGWDDAVLQRLVKAVSLERVSGQEGGAIGSPREDARAVFEPLGYTYRADWSTGDDFRFVKRSAGGNEIHLQVMSDGGSPGRRVAGKSKRDVAATLNVCGVDWGLGISLPVANSDDGPLMDLQVRDQTQWLRVLANLEALVKVADSLMVPELEEMFGPGCHWYEAPR